MSKILFLSVTIILFSACSGSDDVIFNNTGKDANELKYKSRKKNINPNNKSIQPDTIETKPKPDNVPFDEDNHNVKWIKIFFPPLRGGQSAPKVLTGGV